jgi:hypothetical protein
MTLSRWTIAILSTGYDMPDIRADLGKKLNDLGFNVLAYERPDFPVQPGVHSHQACLLAIDQADIALVIIDERSGGLFLGNGPDSITVEEYKKSMKKGKIVIPCVRRQAWDDRHQMFNKEKEFKKSFPRKNIRKMLKPDYVNNWGVLEFIETVRKASKDNYVAVFKNVVDLIDTVEGRLKGLSHWLLKELIHEQMLVVRNIKTTTGMAISLGDVLDSNLYVEPPCKFLSGKGKSASSAVISFQKHRNSIAVLGDPGSGKSTLLGMAYLSHAKQCLKNNLTDLPFFLSLRGRGTYSFDFRDHVKECFETLKNKELFPLIKLDGFQPRFYIDGLDEMTDNQTGFDSSFFSQSSMSKYPYMLSCRTRFALIVMNDASIGNRFSIVLNLLPWNPINTNNYIHKFCNINRCRAIEPQLINIISNEGMSEISTTPLLLTLFFYIVASTGFKIPLDIRNKRSLFSETLKLLARRELGRFRVSIGVNDAEIKLLLIAWRIAAWIIYQLRFTSTTPIKLDDLLHRVQPLIPVKTDICERRAFEGLFDIRNFTNEVIGVVHEQLFEELLAELLCEGMRTSQYPFPDSLDVAVRWEINQLIRSIWAESGKQALKDTLANLVKVYHDNLRDSSPISVIRRNQATYYIGRLEIPEADVELHKAAEIETDLFVKSSIAFSLIMHQKFDIEDTFINQLQKNTEWDSVNRGYHLYYYHDKTELLPYEESGSGKWDNTLRALLNHIESPAIRYIAIRRVELFTIRRFIETRQAKGPLTAEIMAKIEDAVNKTIHTCAVQADYLQKLSAEFGAMKTSWTNVM